MLCLMGMVVEVGVNNNMDMVVAKFMHECLRGVIAENGSVQLRG